MQRPVVTAAVTAILLSIVAITAFAADATDKCASGKLKEASKYTSCRLKAESKAVLLGGAPDFTVCEAKFTAKFTGLETKAGPGVCPTEGDEASINAQITAGANQIAAALSGIRYQDCGDGTVADLETGLMWQKTDDAGGLTDKDNTYTWTLLSSGTAANGTVFTAFLSELNGASSGSCYAGHCDWRLPEIDELVTTKLVLCTPDPCIDQSVFGPQNAYGGGPSWFYWAATTDSLSPEYAWTVLYNTDGLLTIPKSFPANARAVRNGSCP